MFVVDNLRSRKLLDYAEGQSCVMCGADDGTIVCAHSNLGEHGKGKKTGSGAGSLKASDICTAHLCFRCHADYDQGKTMTREQRRDFILTAIVRTVMRLLDQGRVVVR